MNSASLEKRIIQPRFRMERMCNSGVISLNSLSGLCTRPNPIHAFIYLVEYKYPTLCTYASVVWLSRGNSEVNISYLCSIHFTDSPVVFYLVLLFLQ
jgi:hypothetical protein